MNKLKANSKKVLKNVLPQPLIQSIKNLKEKYIYNQLNRFDKKKYWNSYQKKRSLDYENICARLMFYSHAIEKGLSHSELRYNFGKHALTGLSLAVDAYNRAGFSKDQDRYKIALSAIKSYIDDHKKNNVEPILINDLFSAEIIKEAESCDSSYSGVTIVKKKDKENNSERNFEFLAKNRHSIREFGEDKIPLTDMKRIMEEVTEIASKTPTVCNRQPGRLTLVTESSDIERLLKLQGGFKGYPLPQYLLVVSVINNVFLSIYERNEAFIDGGLFGMSVLYALEYKKVAACSLNTMMSVEKENEVKNELQLSEDHSLIMFIALGSFPKEIKVPISYRDSVSEILKVR